MSGVFREATIDTTAITENVRAIGRATGVDVIAVVKSDAYGHGYAIAGRAALAGGAVKLGVTDLGEALTLRAAGITAPVISWLHPAGQRFDEAAAAHIEIGVSTLSQLEAVAATSTPGVVVHIKIDTGLSRNGVPRAEWGRVFAEAARLERIGKIQVQSLFTHLSGTSRNDDFAQFAVFEEATSVAALAGVTPRFRHVAATHAALNYPELRLDAIRTGIGIYGLAPASDTPASDFGLRPAMTLRAGVINVKRVRPGAGVSYGFDYRAPRETTLALVPMGYADGVPRHASGVGPVSIGGKRYTIAGRIAMDQIVIDVGDDPVAIGDEVVLFGDPAAGVPSADEWAAAAGTINYEVVTRIGARVPRVVRS